MHADGGPQQATCLRAGEDLVKRRILTFFEEDLDVFEKATITA